MIQINCTDFFRHHWKRVVAKQGFLTDIGLTMNGSSGPGTSKVKPSYEKTNVCFKINNYTKATKIFIKSDKIRT